MKTIGNIATHYRNLSFKTLQQLHKNFTKVGIVIPRVSDNFAYSRRIQYEKLNSLNEYFDIFHSRLKTLLFQFSEYTFNDNIKLSQTSSTLGYELFDNNHVYDNTHFLEHLLRTDAQLPFYKFLDMYLDNAHEYELPQIKTLQMELIGNVYNSHFWVSDALADQTEKLMKLLNIENSVTSVEYIFDQNRILLVMGLNKWLYRFYVDLMDYNI